MRSSVHLRLAVLVTVPMLVIMLSQPEAVSGSTGLLLAGIGAVTALAVAASLGARYLAAVIIALRLTVGSRSHRHEQALERIAAPRHPNTPGRPRTRAPSPSRVLA